MEENKAKSYDIADNYGSLRNIVWIEKYIKSSREYVKYKEIKEKIFKSKTYRNQVLEYKKNLINIDFNIDTEKIDLIKVEYEKLCENDTIREFFIVEEDLCSAIEDIYSTFIVKSNLFI